jgi:D-alanyl-D-alanine carboxypeptidase
VVLFLAFAHVAACDDQATSSDPTDPSDPTPTVLALGDDPGPDDLLPDGDDAAPDHRALRTKLQDGLDDLRDLGIIGAQAVVRIGDHEIRVRSGVADLRTGAPVPRDGYFRMASNTKTLVAVVALQLIGERKLALEDTVERWLPGVVSGQDNDGNEITIRQLLQHTSGLYNFVLDVPTLASEEAYHQHRFDHLDPADLVALATRHRRLFDPGSHWSYSDTNYVLVGMIINKVTGRPWQAEVESRILGPLGLRHTSYPADRPTLPAPHAEAYQQFTTGGPLVDTTLLNATCADASGGMVGTTTDMSRFWQALQRGQLLRPAQMIQMHADPRLAETLQDFIHGLRYGLGVFWIPNRCGGFWAHPGDLAGESTYNAVTTDGTRAASLYLTTALADPAAAGAATRRALQVMDDAICGPE